MEVVVAFLWGVEVEDRGDGVREAMDGRFGGFAQTRQAPRCRLRVSMPLIGMLMMPAVMAFMRAYPEIESDLDFTDRLVDVIDGGFDVVIRTGEARDSRLRMRRAGGFSHRIVASPDYLAAHGTPATPQDLTDHACHHHKHPSTGKLER